MKSLSESEISISTILKRDSRNRVSLTKLGKKLPSYFNATLQEDKRIILEPIEDKTKEIHWLMKPENKHLLAELEEAIHQKELISRESFKKHV